MIITGGLALPSLVSEVAYIMATSSVSLPLYDFFFKKKSTFRTKALGILTGVLTMTLIMSLANYYFITPVYLWAMSTGDKVMTANDLFNRSLNKYSAVGVVPFNLIKSSIVSVVLLVIHAKFFPWISRNKVNNNQFLSIYKIK